VQVLWPGFRRAEGKEKGKGVGATGEEASVERRGGGDKLTAIPNDSICRTAVYVTRTHGGVGGGSGEASTYPDYAFGNIWRSQP